MSLSGLPQFDHPQAGYAQCGEVPNLNNSSSVAGATGNVNEVVFTFTPHAGGLHRVDYRSDVILGGAAPSSGMTIRVLGGADVFVTAPPTGNADGSRLSPTRLENFVEVNLDEGVEYEFVRWAGGGSWAQGNQVCVADAGLAQYVAENSASNDTDSDVVIATTAFTATNFVDVEIGDSYIQLDNGDTWGFDAGDATSDYVVSEDQCFRESVQIGNNGNTRNVGPAFAGLTVSDIIDPTSLGGGAQAERITSVQATIDNTGSGSLIVNNQTTGESSETSTESWTGVFSSLTSVVFTLNTPLDISVGDLVIIETVGGGGRWRFNFNGTPGHLFSGTSGTGTIANSMAGHMDGDIRHDVVILTDINNLAPDITLVDGVVGTVPATWVRCDRLDELGITAEDIRAVQNDNNTPSKICREFGVAPVQIPFNQLNANGTLELSNGVTATFQAGTGYADVNSDNNGNARHTNGDPANLTSLAFDVPVVVTLTESEGGFALGGAGEGFDWFGDAGVSWTTQDVAGFEFRDPNTTTAYSGGQDIQFISTGGVAVPGWEAVSTPTSTLEWLMFGGTPGGDFNITIQAAGRLEADLQLAGTYLLQDGSTLTVEQAVEGGWMPCDTLSIEEESRVLELIEDNQDATTLDPVAPGATNASFHNGTIDANLQTIATNASTLIDLSQFNPTVNGDLSLAGGILSTSVDASYHVVWQLALERQSGPAGNNVLVQPVAGGVSRGGDDSVIAQGQEVVFSGSYVASLTSGQNMNIAVSGGDAVGVSNVRVSVVRIA